jgi:hypothetical protein
MAKQEGDTARDRSPARWTAMMGYLDSREGRIVRRMLRAGIAGENAPQRLERAIEVATIQDQNATDALAPGSVLRALSLRAGPAGCFR